MYKYYNDKKYDVEVSVDGKFCLTQFPENMEFSIKNIEHMIWFMFNLGHIKETYYVSFNECYDDCFIMLSDYHEIKIKFKYKRYNEEELKWQINYIAKKLYYEGMKKLMKVIINEENKV